MVPPTQFKWRDEINDWQNGIRYLVGGSQDTTLGYVNLADVDGDRHTDLLKFTSTGTVYTYLSNGDGTFPATQSSTSTGPGSGEAGYVHFGDFNGERIHGPG
jgi:hypothetical protein